MLKIAIIGFGKMGQTIAELAKQGGDEIVLTIDLNNRADFTAENLRKADVAIEFTRPETAFENVRTCLDAGVPVVCGTTGWLAEMETAKAVCHEKGGAFFYASNYSVGVNIFFALNRYLAKLMAAQPQYGVQMEEVHHTQKLDHPSGTAITLAQGILQHVPSKKNWSTFLQTAENQSFAAQPDDLPILSKREANVPGTHVVTWASSVDTIEISHVAHSREGFAKGAIAAAHWLVGKKGCFGMEEMLGF